MLIVGDFRKHRPLKDTALMIADPIYDKLADYEFLIGLDLPSILFMRPITLCYVQPPDQIAHWIKPEQKADRYRSALYHPTQPYILHRSSANTPCRCPVL